MSAPYALHCGDCREVMATMEADSVDAIVSDPPYGLSFMGKEWDHGVPGVPFWTEALRVAKPGAHLVAFGGSRTFHRLVCAVEDAGWEIRDCLMWLYGSGFPKSLDVSKAIDKEAGAERKVVGIAGKSGSTRNSMAGDFVGGEYMQTAPATDAARQWSGWGTALKPAYEPIILARKPLRGTVAANVQAHGTGAINVDGCRVGSGSRPLVVSDRRDGNVVFGDGLQGSKCAGETTAGRWPANILLDEAAAAVLDAQTEDRIHSAGSAQGPQERWKRDSYAGVTGWGTGKACGARFGDSGGASRFFYTSKASGEDRARWAGNDHPTVKPTDLMRWLCRLVTPPGGLILDPFMGSGSTGVAAVGEGFRFVGIDLEARHVEIAERRLRHAARQPDLFAAATCP